MKKFGIILLIIAFLLSTNSFLLMKRVSANTGEERPMLMAAWPWDFYYHNPKGSNHNSGSSTIQNPAENQKTPQQSAGTTIQFQESNKPKNSPTERNLRSWLLKISLFLRILLH